MKLPTLSSSLRCGLLVVVSALLTSAGVLSQDLEIERPAKVPERLRNLTEDHWEKVGEDLFRYDFLASPDFLDSRPDDGDDPFGGGSEPRKQGERKNAQQILQEVGIPFPEGASAIYFPFRSVVRAVNTRANMELIELYLAPLGPDPPVRIAVRTEIYELTQLQLLKLLEAGADKGDHAAERDAALELVRERQAKLVAAHSVITSLGQRAGLDDTTAFEVVRGLELPATAPASGGVIGYDSHHYGTILETETNLDHNGFISLHITIEHHTAEPQMDVDEGGTTSPRFHAKQIQANCKLIDGQYLMLGSWQPTGKPEYAAGGGLTHIVFVSASLQHVLEFD